MKLGARSLFLAQRLGSLSLLPILIYVLVWVFALAEPFSHQSLTALFSGLGFELCATLGLLGLLVHASIGMWSVGSDYLNPRMSGSEHLETAYKILVAAFLAGYLVFGMCVIW